MADCHLQALVAAGITVAVLTAAMVFSASVRGGATAFELAGLGLSFGMQTFAEHCAATWQDLAPRRLLL